MTAIAAAILDEDGEIAPRNTRERDIALTFRVSASPDVLPKLGIRPPSEGVMHALLFVLGALNQADERRWISYSRAKTWYFGRQAAYGRYFTYTFVVKAVDLLHAHGLIEHHRAKPGTQTKRQSTMRATPALLEVLTNPATVYHTDPAPLIVVRDADKREIEIPNTREVAAMQPRLATLREAEDSIRLELPLVERTAHHHIVNGSKIPNLSTPSLTRMFSRGSTNCNGRRHVSGGGFQSLPSEYRQQLTINGEPVGCADFRAMHIHLLYAQAEALLDGDPYSDIDGLSRNQAKLALLVAINAPTRHSAVSAIRTHIPTFSHEQAARALEAVCQRHAPIARHFASDVSIRLMRLESDILIDAAIACTKQAVPVLGVHDELIAPLADIEQVAETMRRASRDRTGTQIPVRTNAKMYQSKETGREGKEEGGGGRGRDSPYVGLSPSNTLMVLNNRCIGPNKTGG
jgi:hypothetical protein